jgi:hypothetical protein
MSVAERSQNDSKPTNVVNHPSAVMMGSLDEETVSAVE